MDVVTGRSRWTIEAMAARVVRYADLKPCYNAFIDTRSPGSEAKENFTIIGPGVSENPEQHVHITEPHGFNIGGARQPPACVNSQHSHNTAEVFVVHSGTWRFDLGEHGDDAQVVIGPGDVISLPTQMFRGFTNVGDDNGYLFAVLGGDDPGKVLWAPDVFDMAADYGLVLLESGRLIDTVAGQVVPADAQAMPRTSAEQAGALTRVNAHDASTSIVGPVVATHFSASKKLDYLAVNRPHHALPRTAKEDTGRVVVPTFKLHTQWPARVSTTGADIACGVEAEGRARRIRGREAAAARASRPSRIVFTLRGGFPADT